MFVTSLPGRITGANAISVGAGDTVTVGAEGLATRLRTPSEIVIFDADSTKTDAYHTASGETVEFSGTVILKNEGESDVTVYTLTFDSI